jgi:hypothetical protein
MEREELERRLAIVARYRASGQKATAWAQANDVPLRSLAAWCANARRWQAVLDGVPLNAERKAGGFIAAQLPASKLSAVRIELNVGTTRMELHWPLSHTAELSGWLREMGHGKSSHHGSVR